jgi:hypothetical protein
MVKTLEIKLPVLHPAQKTIINDPARFKVVCCGRRFGKTLLAIDDVVNTLLDGKSYGYFAPTYNDLVKLCWQPLIKILDPVIKRKNETRFQIETITGGIFNGFTLEKDRPGQGNHFHKIAIDEAATVPKLRYIWDETLRATLLDHRGSATFYSTPRGYNDFWGFYQLGIDELQKDWQSFHFTSYDNPHMSKEELEAIKINTPSRVWEQEYLAQFTTDTGAVFRGVHKAAILDQLEPYQGEFIFGIDWGRANDYTVISVIDVNTRRQVAIDRFNQIGWSVQRGRIMALYEQWKPYRMIAETNSIGEPNIEALNQEAWTAGYDDFFVEGFQTTAVSKPIIIDDLTNAIERNLITLQNNEILINEHVSYTLNRTASGRYQYSAPEGGHDDTVIATALSWHGVVESGAVVIFED